MKPTTSTIAQFITTSLLCLALSACDKPVKQQEETIAYLKSIGGNVRLDESSTAMPKPVLELSFTGSPQKLASVNDEAMKRVPDLGRLKRFAINGSPPFGDDGIAALVKIEGLESLFLWGGHNVTDKSFEHFARMKNLVSLDASYSGIYKITGSGLHHLGALKKLRILGLAHLHKLEGKYLADLASLPDLEELNLGSGMLLKDEHLEALRPLQKLKTLRIGNIPLTDACLPHILALTQLEELNLNLTKITGSGLLSLKPLRSLKTLHIEKLNLTETELANLQSALPATKIKH